MHILAKLLLALSQAFFANLLQGPSICDALPGNADFRIGFVWPVRLFDQLLLVGVSFCIRLGITSLLHMLRTTPTSTRRCWLQATLGRKDRIPT